METVVCRVDSARPDSTILQKAAQVLRGSGLVAFPTETVYGLGANALDAAAVGRIFLAKGRPAHNPIIVHAWDLASARKLTADWPETATRLATRFWPGPLTLVLPKATGVPDNVTAGGPTVAVRVPAQPVALALLQTCGVPLAAPSANRSTRLSPTTAEHVLAGLNGRIDMVIDAGPTTGGLESTVLDLTVTPPRLLRPGLVSPGELEAVIGPIERGPRSHGRETLKSPGMLHRHYAPQTPVECVADDGGRRVRELTEAGVKVGWLTFVPGDHGACKTIVLADDPVAYAAGLYAALHELDEAGLERIVVTLPPDTEAWQAVRDRLKRASA